MKNIINNFFYGQVALWKAYWFVGELLNALVILIIVNVEIKIFNNGIIENVTPFIRYDNFNLFNKILVFFWTIFITIGIWRSAEKYKGPFIWIMLTLIFLSYRGSLLLVTFF